MRKYDYDDKAGTSYWEENWSQASLPQAFNHEDLSLDNYVNMELHRYFTKLIANQKELGILELGCANSIWPIYFSQYHQAQVSGLDYSETGCLKSRDLLKFNKVPGDIYCADIFNPLPNLLDRFDLVVSFGVVEHFQNTVECLKACAAFVKPGGYLFTLIPNIPSLIGLIQKQVDRKVYDVHVPLTKAEFTKAHLEAGLILLECDYFMSINLSVVNSGSFSQNPWDKYFRHALSVPSKFCWMFERYGLKIPKNRFTSPYILALSRR